jgi:hypothetical protein
MLNPIIAMLHNVGANRWHPIVFIEHPLPGPYDAAKPHRHKSSGHHTEGFETREAAVANVNDELSGKIASRALGLTRIALDDDIEWDGEGIPAIVAFFVEVDGKVKRAL